MDLDRAVSQGTAEGAFQDFASFIAIAFEVKLPLGYVGQLMIAHGDPASMVRFGDGARKLSKVYPV
jgi:hypothetical protein